MDLDDWKLFLGDFHSADFQPIRDVVPVLQGRWNVPTFVFA